MRAEPAVGGRTIRHGGRPAATSLFGGDKGVSDICLLIRGERMDAYIFNVTRLSALDQAATNRFCPISYALEK